MALGTLSVVSGYQVDNTQKRIHLYAQVKFSAPGDTYPAGGVPLDSVLLALPEITTNSGVKYTQIQSAAGSGYIYQRIPATGCMMILQIPPNGSLTTAAPLQQIPSSLNMQGVYNDTIELHATFYRNA
jgi:hypothetical protein